MSVTLTGTTSGTITFDEDINESEYHTRTMRIQKTPTLAGGIVVNIFGDADTIQKDREFKISAALTKSQEADLIAIIDGNFIFTLTITHTLLISPYTSTTIVSAIPVVCPYFSCKFGRLDMDLWTAN